MQEIEREREPERARKLDWWSQLRILSKCPFIHSNMTVLDFTINLCETKLICAFLLEGFLIQEREDVIGHFTKIQI